MNNALPPYVFLPTGLFLAKLIAHKEGEDRSKWVTDFAVQLVEGAGRDDFARSLIETAVIKQNAAMNRVRRSRAKSELISEGVKNPTRQQIEERLKEIYAEEELTAAATTREGVDVLSNRESGRSVHTTGCDHSQDAPNGNAGEDERSGRAITRNDSRVSENLDRPAPNMRRVPQNEAPAHGFSGGDRAAQGPMSRSPEAAAQSGKDYDQEPDQVSTDSPAGAGVNLDSTQTNKRPDASIGNVEGVNTNGTPITRNGCRAACTSATSGQTVEALEQAGAVEVSPESVFASSTALPVPAKTDPKPTRKAKAEVKPEEQKYPHGEFENIMLTTREYTQLCERLDNADSLIEEADGYFEAQPEKKRKYKSHYAMLLNWDRRRKEFEGVKPRFKTAAEKQRDELQKIADYYASKEVVG